MSQPWSHSDAHCLCRLIGYFFGVHVRCVPGKRVFVHVFFRMCMNLCSDNCVSFPECALHVPLPATLWISVCARVCVCVCV